MHHDDRETDEPGRRRSVPCPTFPPPRSAPSSACVHAHSGVVAVVVVGVNIWLKKQNTHINQRNNNDSGSDGGSDTTRTRMCVSSQFRCMHHQRRAPRTARAAPTLRAAAGARPMQAALLGRHIVRLSFCPVPPLGSARLGSAPNFSALIDASFLFFFFSFHHLNPFGGASCAARHRHVHRVPPPSRSAVEARGGRRCHAADPVISSRSFPPCR